MKAYKSKKLSNKRDLKILIDFQQLICKYEKLFPFLLKEKYDLGIGSHKSKLIRTGIVGFYMNNVKKEGNSYIY